MAFNGCDIMLPGDVLDLP